MNEEYMASLIILFSIVETNKLVTMPPTMARTRQLVKIQQRKQTEKKETKKREEGVRDRDWNIQSYINMPGRNCIENM